MYGCTFFLLQVRKWHCIASEIAQVYCFERVLLWRLCLTSFNMQPWRRPNLEGRKVGGLNSRGSRANRAIDNCFILSMSRHTISWRQHYLLWAVTPRFLAFACSLTFGTDKRPVSVIWKPYFRPQVVVYIAWRRTGIKTKSSPIKMKQDSFIKVLNHSFRSPFLPLLVCQTLMTWLLIILSSGSRGIRKISNYGRGSWSMTLTSRPTCGDSVLWTSPYIFLICESLDSSKSDHLSHISKWRVPKAHAIAVVNT